MSRREQPFIPTASTLEQSLLSGVLRDQTESNGNVSERHDLYTHHRTRLTAAILDAAPARNGGRACLLGAGSCVDVDLEALGTRFEEVHLVDIDAAAVAGARDRQPSALRSRLHCHAPVDLTGVLPYLGSRRPTLTTLAELDALVAPAVKRIVQDLPCSFDTVASCCVATQMSRQVTGLLGRDHPNVGELRRRIITIHLRTLAALLAPDGRALLVNDIISSDTYPLDELPPNADLGEVAAEITRVGNVFHGSDPLVVSQLIRRDPVLAQTAAQARVLAPWLWRTTPQRTMLVHAFLFERR
jgi:hypothetical protein